MGNSKIEKKIFLEDLPKKNGICNTKVVDWGNAHGCIVRFIYGDIYGCIEVLDYYKDSQRVDIKYKDKIYNVLTNSVLNCRFNNMLNKTEVSYIKGTKIEDMTGNIYNRLTVIGFDFERYNSDKTRKAQGELDGKVPRYWICRCECGKMLSVLGNNLKMGTTKSCGCYADESKRNKKAKYTFEQWCIDNNHDDLLSLWDYNMNKKTCK